MSSNGRYLLDQNGRPYLVVGDAPQALIGNASEADAENYFADRQAHGVNAVWINLLCDTYTSCGTSGSPNPSSTYDGIAPFTTAGDISTPNPVYFQKVDHVLNLAAAHGITVFLDPAETGGLISFLDNNGTTKDEAYGEYLASRYKNYPNIVWMMGNDFQSWTNRTDDASVTAIADGLRTGGDHHLMTIELNYFESLSTDDPNWASRATINGAYSYYSTYDEVLNGYNRTPVKPVVFLEGHYEGEDLGPNGGSLGTPIVLRRQEYWTMTSGGAGQLYGNQYWKFQPGWQGGIDSTGATQLQYMAEFFESLPWYQLVPDQDHALVTAGYGTYNGGTSGETASDGYVTASKTPDGTTAVVYLADTHTITVDLAKMSSTVTARWFDPTTGQYSPAGSYPNTGPAQFTSPGSHSDGTDDWVLLLQAGA